VDGPAVPFARLFPLGRPGHSIDEDENDQARNQAQEIALDAAGLQSLQARAQAEIFIMLARSLRLTIDGQGKFYTDAYDNVGDAFYFGVSFLDEVFKVRQGELVKTTTVDEKRGILTANANGKSEASPNTPSLQA